MEGVASSEMKTNPIIEAADGSRVTGGNGAADGSGAAGGGAAGGTGSADGSRAVDGIEAAGGRRVGPAQPRTTSSRRGTSTPFASALVLATGALLAFGACDDDPYAIPWEEAPDTVTLHSLARPELNLYSAFNFTNRRRIRVESPTATGVWDVAVDTRSGSIVLLPPGALGVHTARARIATIAGTSFEEVTEAPLDTASYVSAAPVPVAYGNIYVVRTNQQAGVFGSQCVYYAKLEPLDIDAAGGTLTFVFDSNPVCNDPRLIPPD